MLKITECGIDYEIEYSDDEVRNVLLRYIESLPHQLDSTQSRMQFVGYAHRCEDYDRSVISSDEKEYSDATIPLYTFTKETKND